MENWAFIDEQELVSFRGLQIYSSCGNLGYVTLSQCQVREGETADHMARLGP